MYRRTRSQTKSQLSGSDEDTDFNNICDTLKLLRQQAEALIAAENATNDEGIRCFHLIFSIKIRLHVQLIYRH